MTPIKIVILTQESCAFCDAAKSLFERLGAEYPLAVSALSLESPEGQELAKRGQILFPPGIFIDGEAFSYGRPSERKIRRELDRRARPNDAGGADQIQA